MNHGPSLRLALVACAALLLPACSDDPTSPSSSDGHSYAIVLNSTSLTLSVVPLDASDSTPTRTLELGPQGTPASLAVRGAKALVPLGTYPALAVVDLRAGTTTDLPLPFGSGATGVAIVDDSLAFVGNPDLGTVSAVLYDRRQRLGEIGTGVYPTALAVAGDRVAVADARLENYAPTGPAWLYAIDAETLLVSDSVELEGENANALIVADDAVWVLHPGNFGAADGSLSVVAQGSWSATHFDGFGEFPGSFAREPNGAFLVASFAYGIAEWSLASGFIVAPADGERPDDAVVSAVAVGPDGTTYVLDAGDCTAPGRLLALEGETLARATEVGACPIAVALTRF